MTRKLSGIAPRSSPDAATAPPEAATADRPGFAESLRFWLKLGFISFGGPTGQIAIMHAELVDKRRWVSEPQFLHALNYCMLLPGPEAQQLATYVGWLLHRTAGGLAAGILFVLPSALLMWGLSLMYVTCGATPAIGGVFYGLKTAVMAIVAAAVLRIGRRTLKTPAMFAVAAAAFVAICFGRAPFPVIVLSAGVIGLIGSRFWPRAFVVIKGHGPALTDESAAGPGASHARTGRFESLARTARVLLVGLLAWWLPVGLIALASGGRSTWTDQALFFSKAAMVTFGGAYAVLPYVAQQAVERYAWLTAPQMLDGLGLAETTPGPLIMVVQFVGFLGGWNHPGGLPSWAAATLGAAITTWVTFAPCFLWIFLGAPYVERMRGRADISGALSTITAAVVGVVLNLAVWFAQAVVLPRAGAPDWFAAIMGLLAFAGLAWRGWNVIAVVVAGGLIGLTYTWWG